MSDRLAGLAELTTASKDDRMRFIVGELVTGRWRPGVDDVEASERWGLSLATVRRMATESARCVRLSIGEDAEAIRDHLVARVDGIIRSALERRRGYARRDGSIVEVEDADHGAALRGVELIAKLGGAWVDRSEHRVGGLEDASEDELVASAVEELVTDPTRRQQLLERLSESDEPDPNSRATEGAETATKRRK